MNIAAHGLPFRRMDVSLVDDGPRSVLVTPADGTTHVLNPTARAIWELCDGTTQPEEMVDAICRVFSVSADQAREDVLRTLDQLTAVHLIEWPRTDSRPGGSMNGSGGATKNPTMRSTTKVGDGT